MPLNFYMEITAKSQGDLHSEASGDKSLGNLARGEHLNEITCYALKGDIEIPRDPATGTPQGSRRHHGVTVTKPLDRASPLLAQALVTGEQLESVVLKLWWINSDGDEQHFYTITLEDARCVQILSDVMSTLDTNTAKFPPMEHVVFAYKKIAWEHVSAGTTGSDDGFAT